MQCKCIIELFQLHFYCIKNKSGYDIILISLGVNIIYK